MEALRRLHSIASQLRHQHKSLRRFSQPVMRRKTNSGRDGRMLSWRSSTGGFTLTELMIAGGAGSIIGLISLGALVEGTHLFKSNSTEMIARDQGSRAIRRMGADIQGALTTLIYSDYQGTSGAAAEFGSCIVLQKAAGGSVAYYRYAPTTDPNSGGIYYSPNAGPPNPSTDRLLANSVRDLEFRRDINGSIRIGFDLGTYGYPTFVVGGKESDLVRFSTSSLQRN